MLKLFGGGKPDHPMADPKEVRRILEALPAEDPFKALEDLAHWHDSVAGVEGFKLDQRLHVHFQVDDAAQVRLRKLSRDYFAAARPSRFQENRLWTGIHGYWLQAGTAYGRLVDAVIQNARGSDAAKPQLPALFIRALRSLGQRIKWMHLRYGPVDPAIWGVLNNVYAAAEARHLVDERAIPYAGATETSPRGEFVRALLFSAGSPDSLLPQQIEVAERLIFEVASRATLVLESQGCVYWTDLAQPMAPARLLRQPAAAASIRYLKPSDALGALSALSGKAAGQGDAAEITAEVAAHLALYWSAEMPERKSARHAVKSRLTIVSGLEPVLDALQESTSSLDFDTGRGESWIVENVSAGGLGAVVPQIKGDWLKVGALLALQPDGGRNWLVGMVRRVNKTGTQQARVGIQTLSRSPRVAALRLAGSGAEETGLLLPGGDASSPEIQVVLKPGVFDPKQNLESEQDGRQHVYLPQALVERGDGYEIARYRELIRET